MSSGIANPAGSFRSLAVRTERISGNEKLLLDARDTRNTAISQGDRGQHVQCALNIGIISVPLDWSIASRIIET